MVIHSPPRECKETVCGIQILYAAHNKRFHTRRADRFNGGMKQERSRAKSRVRERNHPRAVSRILEETQDREATVE